MMELAWKVDDFGTARRGTHIHNTSISDDCGNCCRAHHGWLQGCEPGLVVFLGDVLFCDICGATSALDTEGVWQFHTAPLKEGE